ncbi:hypothetical protein [Polaribacter sp.]|uniref:hypothetical protein n=1 Tax=Polaribacter sp. TaxID=1920175 RepID=UPI003F6AA594
MNRKIDLQLRKLKIIEYLIATNEIKQIENIEKFISDLKENPNLVYEKSFSHNNDGFIYKRNQSENNLLLEKKDKNNIQSLNVNYIDDKKSWVLRWKEMCKQLNINNEYVSDITGNRPESIRTVTVKDKTFPRLLKLSVHIFEKYIKNEVL